MSSGSMSTPPTDSGGQAIVAYSGTGSVPQMDEMEEEDDFDEFVDYHEFADPILFQMKRKMVLEGMKRKMVLKRRNMWKLHPKENSLRLCGLSSGE